MLHPVKLCKKVAKSHIKVGRVFTRSASSSLKHPDWQERASLVGIPAAKPVLPSVTSHGPEKMEPLWPVEAVVDDSSDHLSGHLRQGAGLKTSCASTSDEREGSES